ncbi:MAG: copper amine oxidase N-terminal domain-containing protein [Bacillota bacterium]|jgi:hypothetical protein
MIYIITLFILASSLIILFSGCSSSSDENKKTNTKSEVNNDQKKITETVDKLNIPETEQDDEPIMVYFKGEQLLFGTLPEVKDGCIFVPMREIFEAFSANFKWDSNNQTVSATRGNNSISLKIGSKTALNNGKSISLGSKAYQKNGHVMIPLQFVADAFGAQAHFNIDTKTFFINSAHSKGIRTEKFLRIKDGEYFKLLDLGNTTLRYEDRTYSFIGIEENGRFILLSGTTDSDDYFSSVGHQLRCTIIFEDGYYKEYWWASNDKYSPASHSYGTKGMNIHDKSSLVRATDVSMKSDFYQIWDINDLSTFSNHGKIKRIDFRKRLNEVSIDNIDYNKRLYYINRLPILAEQELKPVEESITVGNCIFTLNKYKIEHVTWPHHFSGYNSAPYSSVLNFTVTPLEDTGLHYNFYIKSNGSTYGSRSYEYKSGLFKGIETSFDIHTAVIPICDTNKIEVVVKDTETEQSGVFNIILGTEVPENAL